MKITSNIERTVLTIDENRTALEAAILMAKQYVGSAVITSPAGIKGLFTERDLMIEEKECLIAQLQAYITGA